MAYCGPRALAYEEFLSWSPLSQGAALAWQRRQNARCRCGQIPSEWRRYDEQGRPVLDEHGAHEALYPNEAPYLVKGSFCPACAEADRARRADPYSDVAGWVLHYEPNPDYEEPVQLDLEELAEAALAAELEEELRGSGDGDRSEPV